MRLKLLLLSVCSLAILSSCATVVKMDQTCITCVQSQRMPCKDCEYPASMMIGNECVVTLLETGENIHLNEILKQEMITPAKDIPFTLAKINGMYCVIGQGFKNMWMLVATDKNEAELTKVELPKDVLGTQPVFELFNGELLMRGPKTEYEYLYDEKENIWKHKSNPKAGE